VDRRREGRREGVEIRVGDHAKPSASSSQGVGRGHASRDVGILHQTLEDRSFCTLAQTRDGEVPRRPLPPACTESRYKRTDEQLESLLKPSRRREVDLATCGSRIWNGARARAIEGRRSGWRGGLSIYAKPHAVDLLTITENIARSHHLPVGATDSSFTKNEQVTQQISFNVSTDHETQWTDLSGAREILGAVGRATRVSRCLVLPRLPLRNGAREGRSGA